MALTFDLLTQNGTRQPSVSTAHNRVRLLYYPFAERRRTVGLKYDLSQAASFVPKMLDRLEPSFWVTCLS